MFGPALIFITAIGFAAPAAAQDNSPRLPQNTIDCKQFKKTGLQEWSEVGTAVFDLADVPDINLTGQPVTPRSFKFGGVDLYPVLEEKCGAADYFNRGKKDQGKGDYDSALASFDHALLIDPKNAEAYDNRGSVYAAKGDYVRAVADYNEALRLDPKLESAAIHKTSALEKLATISIPARPAATQLSLEEASAVLNRGLDSHGNALSAVQIPEQRSQEQSVAILENKNASQSESASCRGKKPIYVADGFAGAEGVKSVIEIIFENKHDDDGNGADSEFLIQESRNNQIQWTYRGKRSPQKQCYILRIYAEAGQKEKGRGVGA